MDGANILVSLPEDDVDFLDAYSAERGLPSRSAAVQGQAVAGLELEATRR